MKPISSAVVVLALLVSCGLIFFCGVTPVSAQSQGNAQSVAAPSPAPRQSGAGGAPDLSITATVTARELLFEAVPNPSVEFFGRPERATLWEAERQNIPRPVQPGVTYRDIGIRLKITSIFPDIDRIVAEALGEVAVRDDDDGGESTMPPANRPPPARPPASPSPSSPPSASNPERPRR